MTMKNSVKACLLSMGLVMGSASTYAAGWCDSGKPVKFAGLNWESGMLLTDVLQTILKEGYGCQVDTIPGNSITMESALSSNDIQVLAEEWVGRSEVWNKAAQSGKVVGVGAPIIGATEGWYVPRYLIEGDAKRNIKAKAPDLKKIADLTRYTELFKDQEEPG
ncbi:glycine betaine ABC transporter substrate-binding protein, partial [Pseudomonas cichorii]